MTARFPPFVLALCLLALLPATAAASPGSAVFGGYWQRFTEYWEGVFLKQDGVVMGVLAVGAVALFIITRGKWQK